MTIRLSTLFDKEEDRPFVFEGGDPAVILVHGFPGTPAEMRPLGEVFHKNGWTVHGLLLPGFGSEIDTLFDRRAEEWVGAVSDRLRELRVHHSFLMLVGFSFGGAVSIHAAVSEPIDALVLAAPFWRLGGFRERVIWAVIKRFSPTFQPFQRMDFASPQIRAGLGRILPGLDTGDPETQEMLRGLRVPARILDEVAWIGRTAKKLAPKLRGPALILQGLADDVVLPEYTKNLASSFSNPPELIEVKATHEILNPEGKSWNEVVDVVNQFSNHHLKARQ